MPGLIVPKRYEKLLRQRQHVARRRRVIATIERKRAVAKQIEKGISAAIQKAYPEHLFTVTCDPKDGNIYIDHPLLANAQDGEGARWFIKYDTPDPDKLAVKFAGETLERVNLPRGELKYFDQYEGEAERLSRTEFNTR